MTISLQRAFSLKSANAFGVEARAAWFCRVQSVGDLDRLREDPRVRDLSWWVLGAGSNTLMVGDLEGLVVQVALPGVALEQAPGGDTLVRAGAGEPWPDLVERLVQAGEPGLENLALIPGSVGAAPVQNIGAYGLELAERLEFVEVWEPGRGLRQMATAECDLGYRDSIFKRDTPGSRIVVSVQMRLPRPWQPLLGYAELDRELALAGSPEPGPAAIFHAVCAVRRRKLPDPAVVGNAGSFFKNPVVDRGQHGEMVARHPSLVSYPLAGGRFKLAAGWLIEACGLKGASRGAAGVFERQALVLVNRGGATGREILALAREIQARVAERFGVVLEPEAVIVPGALAGGLAALSS
jgi:UDP-N-acetylmuramate dehydrogenase